MILFIAPIAAWLYNQAADISSGVADFVRSIPSLFAPKPDSIGIPYTPPFLGGQTDSEWYVFLTFDHTQQTIYDDFYQTNPNGTLGSNNGSRVNGVIKSITAENGGVRIITSRQNFFKSAGSMSFIPIIISIKLFRGDGSPDVGPNLPNPSPPSIPNGDLFKPNNPPIVDGNNVVDASAIVLAPAVPLVLVTALAAGYAAAVGAAKAASDALEAVKKIAEALDALKSLWDKLKEFLDEWEKNRPKKRDIVRQTYGQIVGDGALDFFSSNNQKAKAIQLDIVVTNIPEGISKYYGSLSPSRYRYKELGYIAFYSVNQGILETHSIQFKRTTLQIPELAVGFIYHLGLDEAIRGYAFGTFSIEKE